MVSKDSRLAPRSCPNDSRCSSSRPCDQTTCCIRWLKRACCNLTAIQRFEVLLHRVSEGQAAQRLNSRTFSGPHGIRSADHQAPFFDADSYTNNQSRD